MMHTYSEANVLWKHLIEANNGLILQRQKITGSWEEYQKTARCYKAFVAQKGRRKGNLKY